MNDRNVVFSLSSPPGDLFLSVQIYFNKLLCMSKSGFNPSSIGSLRTCWLLCFFFFSSRRRHTRSDRDWSSDVCSSDLFARFYSGRLPIVSSYTPHFGEEPPLTGTRGAGNIFFGNCNLRCVYCQNYQISQTHKEQIKNEVTHERLAEMMLELQARGCHNINFVSPTHFAPQMARAILIAAGNGLRLPIVYNTNAYDSVEVLRLLDGIVDVYLPDLKYADDEAGYLYSKVRRYASVSRAAIAEMHRQMGDELIFAEEGLLKRGLGIRLLVLPNDISRVRDSLSWIRDELSPRVAVSLMAQYYPTNVAGTNH